MISPDYQKEYLLEFKDLHISFSKFLYNLEAGYYNFEWFFYIDGGSKLNNILLEVYTHDSLDKNSLNRVMGTFGYTNFAYIIEYLTENRKDREDIHVKIFYSITERLRNILEDDTSRGIINFNKDTLFVITKSNKNRYDSNDDVGIEKSPFIPGISVSGIKRI